jgi:hypothetical protein
MPRTSKLTCINANAAVAVDWVSVQDADFFRTIPDFAAAAVYIATSAADALFYATYERADALELVHRKRVDSASTPADPIWSAEEAAQSDLLRCIFGNPFRPLSHKAAWLTPTVASLAAAAYEERDLSSGYLDAGRLAVLADALEDSGCTDADILAHCRSGGEHVRGCWVVDLLLGKE